MIALQDENLFLANDIWVNHVSLGSVFIFTSLCNRSYLMTHEGVHQNIDLRLGSGWSQFRCWIQIFPTGCGCEGESVRSIRIYTHLHLLHNQRTPQHEQGDNCSSSKCVLLLYSLWNQEKGFATYPTKNLKIIWFTWTHSYCFVLKILSNSLHVAQYSEKFLLLFLLLGTPLLRPPWFRKGRY